MFVIVIVIVMLKKVITHLRSMDWTMPGAIWNRACEVATVTTTISTSSHRMDGEDTIEIIETSRHHARGRVCEVERMT